MKSALKFLIILIALTTNTALAEDTIKIGGIFSLSSWGAEGGYYEKNGLDLALEDVNNSGGINGKQVEIIIEDSRSDLKQTLSAFRKLVNIDKVPVVIGPNWAEFLEVVTPVANSMAVPVISPSGYKESIFNNNQFVFTLWPPHSIGVAPLAKNITSRDLKKVTVLISDNAYYHGLYEAIVPALDKAKIVHTPTQTFKEHDTDFKAIISKIKHSNSDAVIAFLLEAGSQSSFLRQAKELKLDIPIFGSNGIVFDPIIREDPSIAERVIFFDYYVDGGAEFQQRYKAKFGHAAGNASAKAYDALYIVKQAIENCGESSLEIRDCLRKANYSGISTPIKFDDSGVIAGITANSTLKIVKNGKFLDYDTELN